jgi:hypothetical protein
MPKYNHHGGIVSGSDRSDEPQPTSPRPSTWQAAVEASPNISGRYALAIVLVSIVGGIGLARLTDDGSSKRDCVAPSEVRGRAAIDRLARQAREAEGAGGIDCR